MNRLLVLPFAMALAGALPAAAQAQVAAPAPAAVVAPVRPTLPATISNWLAGDWTGEGTFTRSGEPVASTFRFRTVLDGEAMTVEHAEIAPASFAYRGVISVDSRSGDVVMVMASNKGGGGRVLRSEGWIGETLAFEATPELHAWFARERITFERQGPDRFRATYEMSRDGGVTWRSGDVQTFERTGGADQAG